MLHGGDGGEDAEGAIVFAGVADGVEVRAEQKRFGVAASRIPTADQIKCGILADAHASGTHPRADEFVRAAHCRRGEGAREAPRFFGDFAELVAAAHQLPR